MQWKLSLLLGCSLSLGYLMSLIPFVSAFVTSENSRRKFFFGVAMMIFEVAVKL